MNAKVFLPLAVLGVACVGAVILFATSSQVAGRPTERTLRAVRFVPVEARTVQLEVRSQGTVSPRTESELIPEVSGRVVWTSLALVSGGYFEEGEALLRIASQDYTAAVDRARAALERARAEDEHARQTLLRQRDLAERQVVSDAVLDDSQRRARIAKASLQEARVALEQVQRDLTRTEITAPFTGRVREERVDVGQFLNRGQPFASIYATDFVEVRLPIADAQLAHLELPIWQRGSIPEGDLPEVVLSTRFAGEERSWRGRVVRTEGEIDAKSRLVHVVARVSNHGEDSALALPVGLFVQARIEGRSVQDVVVVPRRALQNPGQVLVIDAEDRLRFRAVEVLRIEDDEALVRSGLDDGERVCISPIQAPVDGMRVRPVPPADTAGGPPA
jgi:RND family efflux transporter MFP subunit